MGECRLIVLARAPRPGHVKTRLIAALGADGAARLYAALLRYTLDTARRSSFSRVEVCGDPDCEHPAFDPYRGLPGWRFTRQAAGDIGARMCSALAGALGEASAAVLVGSDCPTLTEHDLDAARTILCSGCDAVLAPAEDGGYVLIGLRRVAATLFDSMPWGGDEVTALTRARLAALGWRWEELPMRWDVDRPEDVARLAGEPELAHLMR